jgi:hypothetical protein
VGKTTGESGARHVGSAEREKETNGWGRGGLRLADIRLVVRVDAGPAR